jgi:hypothetical protein
MARSQSAARPVAGPVLRYGMQALGQSADQGARPILFAATARAALCVDPRRPDRRDAGGEPVRTGSRYFGPRGPGGLRGAPTAAAPSASAGDLELAREMWEASAEATGVHYAELG